jgi:predicted SAM-dependent methyltransferase
MKLNVGSGAARGKYRAGPSGPEGWVCFDLNPQGRPHVVGDAFKMPFKDNAFEEIHCIHVLEHLGRDKWPIMLAEMFRVLTPDGQCYVEVPDFEAQCVRFIKALQSKLDPFTVHKHRTGIWG